MTDYLLLMMLISSCSLFLLIPEMTEARKVLKSDLSLAPSSSMLTSSWATLENLLESFTPLRSYTMVRVRLELDIISYSDLGWREEVSEDDTRRVRQLMVTSSIIIIFSVS